MRKIFGTMCIASAVGVGVLSNSCSKTTEEKAAQAAREFCKCLEKNSLKTCEDKLKSDYLFEVTDEVFIKEFNAVNTCDAYLYKKY